MQQLTLSAEDKDRLLAQEEGYFLDFKSRDTQPAKITRIISAFANSAGGELYIGIEDDHMWRGFERYEDANGFLQIFEELFPLGQYYSYMFYTCDSSLGHMLKVEVHKTRNVTTASNGIAYLRRGAQNLPQDSFEKRQRLELAKGVTSFETETVDLALDEILHSDHLVAFMAHVVPSATPREWLKKQQFVRDGKPTVAAILLFYDEPQSILPKRCGIKVVRYATRHAEGSRSTLDGVPETIEGTLYTQIRTAVRRTVELVESEPVIGATGIVSKTYPFETLHEIITNAVLHRDYSHQSDIQVRIFDNRIEVESPGPLPGHITEQNILNEQLSRNPVIVRWLNKYPDPPNKDIGEGLNTAFEAMRRIGLKEPTVQQSESKVTVRITHEPLAKPEVLVLRYLESHSQITNSVAREITSIASENEMKRVFQRLERVGSLVRVPGRRGSASAWCLPDQVAVQDDESYQPKLL